MAKASVQVASLSPDRALDLIRGQIQKGRALLANRPLTSSIDQSWKTVTRDILIRTYGAASPNVASVMQNLHIPMGVGDEQEWEKERAKELEHRLEVLGGLADLLQLDVEAAAPATIPPQPNRDAVIESDILLSWSGQQSKKAAEAFYGWLKEVLPGITPWMSSENIAKGKGWFEELMKQLDKTRLCLICLTPDNVSSPWIFYETGAIAAKKGATGVFGYLIGVESGVVSGTPIGQFQWTLFEKKDTWQLIRDVNRSLPTPHNETILQGNFNQKWPKLKRRLDKISAGDDDDSDAGPEQKPLSRKARTLLVKLTASPNYMLTAWTTQTDNKRLMAIEGKRLYPEGASLVLVADWYHAFDELKPYLGVPNGTDYFLNSEGRKLAQEFKLREPELGLSDEAIAILLEPSPDHPEIYVGNTMHGFDYRTGTRHIQNCKDKKIETAIKEALDELVAVGAIAPYGNVGFKVTMKGFQIANGFKQE